ncbi:MAG: glycosyltransferase [Candidatus Nanopelagicales bacterium]
MTSVAALLVTRDAERWLPALLDSVAAQTRQPDLRVAVDDGSTDGTQDLLRASGFRVITSSTTAADTVTRIARNFAQGVDACADYDVVVLGDHDDVWHPGRVAHQADSLERAPDALMVASDGRLVDGSGVPTGARCVRGSRSRRAGRA